MRLRHCRSAQKVVYFERELLGKPPSSQRFDGRRDHLNDDLHIVTLSQELIASPPVELWPKVIRRLSVPADVEEALLNKLDQNQ